MKSILIANCVVVTLIQTTSVFAFAAESKPTSQTQKTAYLHTVAEEEAGRGERVMKEVEVGEIRKNLEMRNKGCPKDRQIPIQRISIKSAEELTKNSRGAFKGEAGTKYVFYSGKSGAASVAGVVGPMVAGINEAKLERHFVGALVCDMSTSAPKPVSASSTK